MKVNMTEPQSYIERALKDIELTKDQIKTLYRGNFTFRQAAAYFGKSVDWVKAKVEAGELGVNEEGTRISRRECERFLERNTFYKKPIMERSKRNGIKNSAAQSS